MDSAVIGIDVGGTKTHLRLVADGASHDLRVPTASWLAGTTLHAPASVAGLLSLVYELTGSRAPIPLVVGAHGCDSPHLIEAFREALQARWNAPLTVLNDAFLVAPAAGEHSAVGIIAGTGSIVVGRDHQGRELVAGGHGWLIADPGSAPWLVREGVLAVLERSDLGRGQDALGIELLTHFAAADAAELAQVFTRDAGIHCWADAAVCVFEAAASGSVDADGVIHAGARALARHTRALLDRGAEADAVVAAGGVVIHQPGFVRALREALVAHGVTQPLRVLHDDPVAGAVTIARQLAPATNPENRHTDQWRSP